MSELDALHAASTAAAGRRKTPGRRADVRARNHPAWWAFLVHRLSGLALAVFLPMHFWALGTALHGAAAFDSFLAVTRQPAFVFAEWGLVTLLAAHLIGGVRVLLIEYRPWSGLRKNLIAATAGGALVIGLAFALSLTL
ncbi:succinate dehydrogenase, cytochrome b556 subunit [Paraburkholderia sp. SOS3]|uniref:succinate dehydrogenase, cytochrome b556 subunit n=1 Tax=Paraburkholderia sp. SOS3 TaxID=1926494 RepID=UPI0009474A37|nr:succinate dehydrogenase, cytochrome b556 subunit [Paraburkholderia sp. SOS3]APR38078.1 succinate dehydrogenase, cytochrome b556 subunit [Paraburkholderia sp. SOS3]